MPDEKGNRPGGKLAKPRRWLAGLRAKRAELSIVYEALNSSTNGVLIADLQGRIVYVNPAFLSMFEYGGEMEIIGRSAGDLFVARDINQLADVKAAVDASDEETLEFSVQRRDETVFPVEVAASNVTDGEGDVVGRMALFVDITARKKMEEQLKHRERLAVLGQVAGGIVHELRNPLGWIKGSTYFLETALEEPDADVTKAIELLKRGVIKSEKIVDGLLSFVRPTSPERQKVCINDIVLKALSDMNLPENIRVVQNLDDSLPAILADPDQLGLVFDNIILNAAQAMPGGGVLTIESGISAGWVSVSFADTGVGISDENLDRIFEPLFTTKDEGVGLGLALIKMLVEGHGGRIEVESALGKGSVFAIHLPLGREEDF